MRRFLTKALVAVGAALVLASQASAATIPIGWLQWDETGAANGGIFSVVNQTGANVSLDGSFPVVTQLLFTGLSLDVTTSAGTSTILQAAMVDAGDGFSFDTAAIPLLPYPTKAVLTGFVNPLLNVQVDLTGGGPITLWNILGSGAITDINGNPLVVLGDGSADLDDVLSIIYVEAERVPGAPVPEPMSVVLLGTGVAGLFLARRRRAVRN